MNVPKFLIAVLILASLSATAAEYDLKCKYTAGEFHGMNFRFGGHYTVNEDGTASLENYKGLLFSDPELYIIEIYEGEKLENDASYKARPGKWVGHYKFNLESLNGPGLDPNSGGTNYLLLSKEPVAVTTKRRDKGPNPGTEYHSTFHAGLEYYLGDPGARTEVTCTGFDYVSDREAKKKKTP